MTTPKKLIDYNKKNSTLINTFNHSLTGANITCHELQNKTKKIKIRVT